MILRARIVLPVSQPAIDDGAIIISGNQIVEVGRWSDLRSGTSKEVLDLGECILMPGLVNAHCHLELTALAGKIPRPDSFTSWVQSIIRHRQELDENSVRDSWLQGAGMLLRSGTTTVANIESTPEILNEVRLNTLLRVHSFLEITGVLGRKTVEDILASSFQIIEKLSVDNELLNLSPHAPYSVPSGLLKLIADHAAGNAQSVCMHIAESEEEWDLFQNQRGELASWLSQHRDTSEFMGQSPVQYVRQQGLLNENLIAIHANYLEKGDIELLAKNKVSIVHCPQSHKYFGHTPFRWKELHEAKINICLGTDSLASTSSDNGKPSLNLFDEMRLFAKNTPECTPENIIQMVTVNAAKALQQEGRIGEFSSGAFADCVVLQYEGKKGDVFDHLTNADKSIRQIMIGGQWL